MIACILIIGFFVMSVIGLAILGQHIENPTEAERLLDDRLALMQNQIIEFGRVIGEQLVPAMQRAVESVNELAVAFAAIYERK